MEMTDVFVTVTTVYKIPVQFKGTTDAELSAKWIFETTDPEDLEKHKESKTVEYIVENP